MHNDNGMKTVKILGSSLATQLTCLTSVFKKGNFTTRHCQHLKLVLFTAVKRCCLNRE